MNHSITYDDFRQLRRLERAVQQLCRHHGYDGDPYALERPRTGSHKHELWILWLTLGLPPDLRRAPFRDAACRMIRSIVMTSTDASQSGPPVPSVEPRPDHDDIRISVIPSRIRTGRR